MPRTIADYLGKLHALSEGTLSAEGFSHTDHIGVAYEALACADFFSAASRVAAGIQQLAERAGAPDKFNATITWAFISLIAERMRTTEHADAEDFIRRNPDLANGRTLRRLYSDSRMNSDLARAVALLPDRAAAPA